MPSEGSTGADQLIVATVFIDMENNALTGEIPAELAGLEAATSLRLGRNNFGLTSIPEELYSMVALQELELFACNVSGPVSPSIGNLTELTLLRLESNALTGGIPEEVGNLDKLLEISLGNNQLTGQLPSISALLDLRKSQTARCVVEVKATTRPHRQCSAGGVV